jgi:hypothetical protein
LMFTTADQQCYVKLDMLLDSNMQTNVVRRPAITQSPMLHAVLVGQNHVLCQVVVWIHFGKKAK